MTQVVVRTFRPSDSGFIFSTLGNGIYHSSIKPTALSKDEFFDQFRASLHDRLKNSNISILCLMDDPDFLLGYSLLSGKTLDYIFIKPDYRKQGLAKLLLKNKIITNVNKENLTRIGYAIVEEHRLQFPDYKGEENG